MAAPYAGTHTGLEYDMESTYATAVSPFGGTRFGCGVALTTGTRTNNLERVTGLGETIACKIVEKQLVGTWAVDFLLTETSWMKDIVFAAAGANWEVTTDLQSFHMRNFIGGTQSDSDAYIDMLGCVLGEWSISAAVGEAVRCTLSGLYADELLTVGATAQTDTNDTFEPVTFATASLKIDGLNVQNFTLSGRTNVEQIFGLGSRTSSAAVRKVQEIDVSVDAVFDAAASTGPRALLGLLYTGVSTATGPGNTIAATATLEFEFTDYTGTSDMLFTVTTFKFNTGNIPQNVNDVVKVTLDGMARRVVFDEVV
jgi:hypothetical protein